MPSLDPLTLWQNGDTYHGGGLFSDDQHYWLNDGPYATHTLVSDQSGVIRKGGLAPQPCFGSGCDGVYFHRLLRDGWRFETPTGPSNQPGGIEPHTITSFTKGGPHGVWLRKIAHAQVSAPLGKSSHWDEHVLLHPESGHSISQPEWEWAEFADRRLVYAARGRLHAAAMQAGELRDDKVLHDFNEVADPS